MGKGLPREAGEGVNGAPGGRYDGIRHAVRRVAKGYTEARQIVSIGV